MDWKDYVSKNPAILLSDKTVRALLGDVYLNDQLSVNLMMNAYSIGIVTEMRSSYPADGFTISRWSKRLVTDFGVSDEKAKWTIETWTRAITPKVLRDLEEAEKFARFDEEEERRRHEEEIRFLAEEALERQMAEEAAKEEARRNTPDSLLKTKDDYQDRYINPKLVESPEYIYVPCGFGQGDNGFLIHGIEKQKICKHPDANVYALIYNYLTRNSSMTEDDIPMFLQSQNTVYEMDYQGIYRLAITLLQMIRHNCIDGDSAVLNYPDDKESLKYAVRMINHYSDLFSRLIGIEPVRLTVTLGRAGIPVSLYEQKHGIYITNNDFSFSNARELWYGKKINYHLTRANQPDLEYILREISNFDSFKEGQFTALCDMLACRKHAVCIMPTGSGKSLIFYMASLLQPLPLFVVSPTDILIQDQIRNLKMFHHMDNVAHLQLTRANSFADWEICNSLNYLTPMTFQNRHLLVKFRYLNAGTKLFGVHEERIASGALVSYVVLDEIHCLSNWGHDFRPEYLMLSKYLNKFLDHIVFWGFTATANYTVVEDVQKQLSIPQNNIFSPIAFEHFNVRYDYRALSSESEMLQEIVSITSSLIERNERTIVFTKNDSISRKVADAIGWEADIFLKDNPAAYYHFADRKSLILVASDELGVGINLPDIRNVIHFGLPISKNEYVQEIGRAGRANEQITSFILYLAPDSGNVPEDLLKRSTPIQSLPSLLKGYDNDYTDVYKKLSNGAVSDDELYEQLLSTYHGFVERDKAYTVDSYPYDSLERVKQHLYMLYLTGFINDWYTYSESREGNGIDILVDICSSSASEIRRNKDLLFHRMKDKTHDYFEYMGNNREGIFKTDRSEKPEEIIRIFVDWYYKQYLYHHNEQFLDFFDFLQNNSDCDEDKITEEIKDFFVLPFAKLKSDEALFNELTIREIISKAFTGVSKKTIVNLERINSTHYSYKIDLALFCGQLRMNNEFEGDRLDRVLSKLPQDEIILLRDALSAHYPACDTSSKISLLNYMEQKSSSFKTSYKDFLENVYGNGQKDIVYFGVMARRLNKGFKKMRR